MDAERGEGVVEVASSSSSLPQLSEVELVSSSEEGGRAGVARRSQVAGINHPG